VATIAALDNVARCLHAWSRNSHSSDWPLARDVETAEDLINSAYYDIHVQAIVTAYALSSTSGPCYNSILLARSAIPLRLAKRQTQKRQLLPRFSRPVVEAPI
jgi:hypothetical protein